MPFKDYEKQKAAIRAWKKRNRPQLAAYARKWQAAHPGLTRGYSDKYYAAHPEKLKAKRKRASKLRAARTYFRGYQSHNLRVKLMLSQDGLCNICGASLRETGAHLDHIISVALGGSNLDYNRQLLCPKCNAKKGHKLFKLQKNRLVSEAV